MSALEIFKGLPQNKSELEVWKQSVKLDILNGMYDTNELPAIATLSKKLEIMNEVFSDPEVKEVIRKAIDLFPDKGIINNCMIQKRMSAGSWTYDGDPVLLELEKETKELADKIKNRKAFLQSIPEEGTADPETGELIHKAVYTKGYESYAIRVL